MLCTLLAAAILGPAAATQEGGRVEPLRLAIAGLVHGHVGGFLKAAQSRGDVRIVGIFDSDRALLRKYADRYTLPESVLFTELGAMLDRAARRPSRRSPIRMTIRLSSKRLLRGTST